MNRFSSYYYNNFKASEKKNLFNAAANGLIDELESLISNNRNLLSLRNKDSNHLPIFYSVKNSHLKTTLFLLNNGQPLPDIERIAPLTRHPEKFWIFFKELNSILKFGNDEFEKKIYFLLKSNCYIRNDFSGLEELLRIEGPINWSVILTEYRKCHPNSLNKSFIRDITLKYLIEE